MFFYPWFQLRWDLPAFGTYSDTYYTSTECSQNMNLGNGTFVEVNIPLGWWVWSWNFTSKIPLFKCSESTICYVRLVVAETICLLKVCLDHTEMKNFFSKVFYWKHTKFVYVYRIIYLKKKWYPILLLENMLRIFAYDGKGKNWKAMKDIKKPRVFVSPSNFASSLRHR